MQNLKVIQEQLEKAKFESNANPKMKARIRQARKEKKDVLNDREQEVATSSDTGEGQESKWRKPKSGEKPIKLDRETTEDVRAFAGTHAVPKAGKAFVGTSGRTERGHSAEYKKWKKDGGGRALTSEEIDAHTEKLKVARDAAKKLDQQEFKKADLKAKKIPKVDDEKLHHKGDKKMKTAKHMNGTNTKQYNYKGEKIIHDRVPKEVADLSKKAPSNVDPEKHERCVKDVKKKGHDVGSAHAICTSSMKKSEADIPKTCTSCKNFDEHKDNPGKPQIKAKDELGTWWDCPTCKTTGLVMSKEMRTRIDKRKALKKSLLKEIRSLFKSDDEEDERKVALGWSPKGKLTSAKRKDQGESPVPSEPTSGVGAQPRKKQKMSGTFTQKKNQLLDEGSAVERPNKRQQNVKDANKILAVKMKDQKNVRDRDQLKSLHDRARRIKQAQGKSKYFESLEQRKRKEEAANPKVIRRKREDMKKSLQGMYETLVALKKSLIKDEWTDKKVEEKKNQYVNIDNKMPDPMKTNLGIASKEFKRKKKNMNKEEQRDENSQPIEMETPAGLKDKRKPVTHDECGRPFAKDELDEKIKAKLKAEMDRRKFGDADTIRHKIDRDLGEKNAQQPKPDKLLQSERVPLKKSEIEISYWDDDTVEIDFFEGNSQEAELMAKKLKANGYEELEKKDWSPKAKHKSDKGGLTAAGRKSYNKATGGNLKAPQPGGGPRKRSFCARNKGQIDKHNINCKKTPDKRACKARRRWKC